MVPGLTHHLRRAGDDLWKLLTEQHENDAVGGKLNGVPARAATNPGDGKCLTALLHVTHGDASRDGGENAGTMQVLGQEVSTEGHQQADQNLRTSLLAEMPRYPVLCEICKRGDADSNSDAADCDPQERAEGINEGERPGQSRGDSKTHADQTRGVVEQGLAF